MGSGYLESVYERCMLIELKKAGLYVKSQYPIKVWYENQIVGEFVADLVVERRVPAIERSPRIELLQVRLFANQMRRIPSLPERASCRGTLR